MQNLKFFLIGNGRIAQYHKEAIKKLGGEIYIYDPVKYPFQIRSLEYEIRDYNPDYAVIASPSYLHREQTKIALKCGCKVIVEKPAVLPWEPIIDSDNVNIVLQLRYLENLPKKADLISVRFVRDEEYFKTWKGDPRLTGGIFYNLFIHYIQLSIMLGAKLEGRICADGLQEKIIYYDNGNEFQNLSVFNIESINMQDAYDSMYEDVVINKNHIKPRDIFYLNWILDKCNWDYGLGGKNIIGKRITFDPNKL